MAMGKTGLTTIVRSGRAASRAFTYMEMMVSILVVLLISALVIPRVVAFLQSRAQKDLEGSIIRLPNEARADAIKAQMPVSISIQDNQLVVQEEPPAGVQTVNGTQQQANTAPTVLTQVDLGNTLQIASVQKNGQPADTGTWKWMVYPDGSADDAGIEFAEGNVTKTLLMPAYGDSTWLNGPPPSQSPTMWPAGQLQSALQTTTTQAAPAAGGTTGGTP